MLGRALPWLGLGGAGAGLIWLELQRRDVESVLAAETLRCETIEADVQAERLADRRQCQADKREMDKEHLSTIEALKGAFAERERILETRKRLAVDKARLEGAESVLASASSSDPEANALLQEVRRLRIEMETRESALEAADQQLLAATEEIERLGMEKRKMARALDAANLAVAEAEQARGDAAREVQQAKERAVELEWDRFVLNTVQEVCWAGMKRRREVCRTAVQRDLLQAKVEWLVCRLEQGARPTLTQASALTAPTDGARLLYDRGSKSTWLVLCDHALRDAESR
jgi:hypothetical protein